MEVIEDRWNISHWGKRLILLQSLSVSLDRSREKTQTLPSLKTLCLRRAEPLSDRPATTRVLLRGPAAKSAELCRKRKNTSPLGLVC